MSAKAFAISLVVACIIAESFSASITRKREVDELETCAKNTPCGWAVYARFTRVIDYFMKNKCNCPEFKMCVRTDDDISVSAYVYRCRDGDKSKNKGDS